MVREVRFRQYEHIGVELTSMISIVAADDPETERERKELDERFTQMRPEVLETLRECLLAFWICISHFRSA